MVSARCTLAFLALAMTPLLRAEDDLGAMWGTAAEEAKYYPIVNIPIPIAVPMRPGGLEILPDGRLAVGTRRGDIYFIKGAFDTPPSPEYHLFSSGQDETFSLSWKDGAMTATTFGEVTRITDTDGDGVADRYDTLSSNWGYGEYHEFAFASKHDPEGNIWVVLGLSSSYESHNLFRGWAVKVTPDGKMIPVCSGLRSPAGVGANKEGVMLAIESQGPWNGCCSLKHLKEGGFLGHPASYNWYPFAPNVKVPEFTPKSESRMGIEKKRVKELVPPVVLFPYIKMGRSVSGFRLNKSAGKFGPFDDQIFIGDYSLSIVMRATTEQVNGVWQGACYPFREGLASGIMNVEFSPKGQLVVGGFTTNAQWPVRGAEPFALQRIDWNGVVPFEVKEITIKNDGFVVTFTKPVDKQVAAQADAYNIATYRYIYHAGYGSPEVDKGRAQVTEAVPSADGLSVYVHLEQVKEDFIHDFDFSKITEPDGKHLVHNKAYYTVNEIPKN
jgi:hypothetical protein